LDSHNIDRCALAVHEFQAHGLWIVDPVRNELAHPDVLYKGLFVGVMRCVMMAMIDVSEPQGLEHYNGCCLRMRQMREWAEAVIFVGIEDGSSEVHMVARQYYMIER